MFSLKKRNDFTKPIIFPLKNHLFFYFVLNKASVKKYTKNIQTPKFEF